MGPGEVVIVLASFAGIILSYWLGLRANSANTLKADERAAARAALEWVYAAAALYAAEPVNRRVEQFEKDFADEGYKAAEAPQEFFGPNEDELAPIIQELRRTLVEMRNERLRTGTTTLLRVLDHSHTVLKYGEYDVRSVSTKLTTAGESIVGAFLRDKRPPSPAEIPELEAMLRAIAAGEEHVEALYQSWLETREEYAKAD